MDKIPSYKKPGLREMYRFLKAKNLLPKSNLYLVMGGILYFVFPFDLIPDFIPPMGQLDDLLVIFSFMMTAINRIRSAYENEQSKPEYKNGMKIIDQ